MNVPNEMDLRAHFHLHATPFTREIAVGDQWPHPQFDQTRNALLGCVHARQSGALIAPAGSGKTQVLRGLREALPEARYRVHYVYLTSLSKRDFCREVAAGLGLRAAGHLSALVRAIQSHSRSLLDDGGLRPVLIIDEAHELRTEVLGVLRVLTNFEMDSRLVVSVILAGQKGLRAKLRKATLECIRGRLSHIAQLRLLSREESCEYIQHRLRVAGAVKDVFAAQALDAVYECSQGNLRAIDRIASKSLQVAAQRGVEVIGVDHVVAARALVLP